VACTSASLTPLGSSGDWTVYASQAFATAISPLRLSRLIQAAEVAGDVALEGLADQFGKRDAPFAGAKAHAGNQAGRGAEADEGCTHREISANQIAKILAVKQNTSTMYINEYCILQDDTQGYQKTQEDNLRCFSANIDSRLFSIEPTRQGFRRGHRAIEWSQLGGANCLMRRAISAGIGAAMSSGGSYLLFRELQWSGVRGIVIIGTITIIVGGVGLLWDALSQKEWD
jgi:hypothetical protein